MRYIFCGARDWADKKKIDKRVAKLTSDDLLIEGGAPGADFIAGVVLTCTAYHTAPSRPIGNSIARRRGRSVMGGC